MPFTCLGRTVAHKIRTALDETRDSGRTPLPVHGRGVDLLTNPMLNKGTAFSERERVDFEIGGLIPPRINTIEEQVELELEHVRRKTDDLEQYIGLAALQDRNETLFYRLLTENLEEFVPIVYTPTVGRACQQFSHILRRPRGLWITPDDVVAWTLLRQAADARRAPDRRHRQRAHPGSGRPGRRRMFIPIGKLSLYTAAAGCIRRSPCRFARRGHRSRGLLADPLYLGYRYPRLRGDAYDAVIEAFVERSRPSSPRPCSSGRTSSSTTRCASWTATATACRFNDDIQGTGAVVVGGLLAARRAEGGLRYDRFMLVGAGAAGIGIARTITRQLVSRRAASRGGA